jgi:hypothetical protein
VGEKLRELKLKVILKHYTKGAGSLAGPRLDKIARKKGHGAAVPLLFKIAPIFPDYLAAGGGVFTGIIRLSQPSRRLSPELCVIRLVRNQRGWPSGGVRS